MTRFRLPVRQAGIGIVLSLSFVSRWLLSGHNSYWLDELVSVVQYGVRHDSGWAAIRSLSRHSIHPPLYQLILYYWMRVFGDGEVATRFLSNLYVTGAGLCLYLLVRKAAGERRALMATIFFSLMSLPFYYAMETRSYAQTLFLTSLSSLAASELMRVLQAPGSWRARLLGRASILLVATNTCVLLTHYYNSFFLGSQGLFLLGWVTWHGRSAGDRKPRELVKELALVATPLLAPLALLLMLWGPVMTTTYDRFSYSNKVESAASIQDPFSAFFQQAVAPNFLTVGDLSIFSAALLALCAVLLTLFYIERARAARQRRPSGGLGVRVLGVYALTMAFVPFLFACALFAVSKHERYSPRYFVFTTPLFAILIVLAIEQAVSLVGRLTGRRALRAYLAHSALVTLLVTTALVLPGTYSAATKAKADWRGIAKLIANVTSADPKHRYILFETGFGGRRLAYYLERAGSSLEPRATIKPPGGASKFVKRYGKAIARHDFLILSFTHLKDSKFEKLTRTLDATYHLHSRLLDDGRGIIIYRVGE